MKKTTNKSLQKDYAGLDDNALIGLNELPEMPISKIPDFDINNTLIQEMN